MASRIFILDFLKNKENINNKYFIKKLNRLKQF